MRTWQILAREVLILERFFLRDIEMCSKKVSKVEAQFLNFTWKHIPLNWRAVTAAKWLTHEHAVVVQ